MIAFHDVSKQYDSLVALADVSFEVADAEFVFLVGPTGAGKSTILKLVIREELPSSGKVFVDSLEVSSLPSSRIPHLRRQVGTIFQDFKLLPQRTVAENVAFPLEILGLPDREIDKTTKEILELVNLEHKANHFPSQLSGGESQRTAIARAMVMRPEIILADEPTGNLDARSAWEVMQLLGRLNNLGTTVIMATHNIDITSSLPHRKLELQKGRVVHDTKQKGSKQKNK
ncbi:MAG: cell division ATP-binding protein FtsE [Candidatus Woykebacteria bacterium GWB1_45_5]|uniref:Cell division ATP-binding protein FtsE n=2 Tax=Candidatus Woykeibacteriota TaxID=1817899 RepID=A0A1G1W256_9BACT|nr:MAG: cell division ATP-binding protein FtsE [Candidatus Woykebacteria bacterium GWA1_44_8]OGY24816.1 MAG: cell division ATP-binding protein FtsE [Candidatus Woykebacteria bacterium GWB1_45_5]